MARDRRPDEPTQDFHGLPLREYMVQCGQSDPVHFKPIVDVFQDVLAGKRLRIVFAAPRQHGKTTLVLHALPWLLLAAPKLPIAYVTYGQQYSDKQSRVARSIAQRTGVRLSEDHNTIKEWHTREDGYFLSTSIDGPLTGYTVRLGLIDDPFKGRAEAESQDKRDAAYDWLRGDLMGCCGPKSSLIIVASRYHEDDLSGRMVREGWDEVRIPAICDDEENDPLGRKLGDPLCPWGPDPDEPRDLEFLRQKEIEVGPYDWASLFQGRPAPPDAGVFRGAFLYTELPPIRRISIGFDLTYTATGDKLAIVVLGESDLLGPDGKPILYVLDVFTIHKSAIESLGWIHEKIAPWRRGALMSSYVSHAERELLLSLAHHEDESQRIKITPLLAKTSKLIRAAVCSRRWNAGSIRVRRDAPWADTFVRAVCGFTGLEGGKDDEVDALVSAFDRVALGGALRRESYRTGKRRM